MKLKTSTLSLIIAAVTTSCSHSFYYRPDPTATNPNNMIISNGLTYAVSEKNGTTVVLAAEKYAGQPLQLRVVYQNNSQDRSNAIPEDIQVFIQRGTKTKQLKVFSANQYVSKVQRKQNFAMAMQSMSSAMNNTNAGYSASATTASASSSNGIYVNGSSTTIAYDASKVSEANARSNQEINAMADQFSQSNSSLSQSLLRANTVFKGQTFAGYVIVDTGNSFNKKISVKIPFGNVVHEFVLLPNLK